MCFFFKMMMMMICVYIYIHIYKQVLFLGMRTAVMLHGLDVW